MKQARTYQRRPSTQRIEAIRYVGGNADAVIAFCGETDSGAKRARPVTEFQDGRAVEMLTVLAGVDGAQGWVPTPIGHWVIRSHDPTEHLYPCDNAAFGHNWEEVR